MNIDGCPKSEDGKIIKHDKKIAEGFKIKEIFDHIKK